jgi:hypothetical protein
MKTTIGHDEMICGVMMREEEKTPSAKAHAVFPHEPRGSSELLAKAQVGNPNYRSS